MKAKVKGKIPQSNTIKPKDKKEQSRSYITCADADMLYMHDKGIDSLIQNMYQAIISDDTIDSILDYLVRKGIPRQSYYMWKAKYPQLEEAHDTFNSIIGNRLFKRINYDVKTIHIVMPNYDPDVWKKMVEYQAKLKEEDQATQKVVIMESMCSHEDHK